MVALRLTVNDICCVAEETAVIVTSRTFCKRNINFYFIIHVIFKD